MRDGLLVMIMVAFPWRKRPSRSRFRDCGVLFEKFHCADDRLLNGELWLPAERANGGTVQKDERIVTDPAAIAAAITQLGLESEMAADPPDRIVDLAVLVRAEVEDVDLLGSGVDSEHHGVEAVLNIQIRLTLGAVAEHLQVLRMGPQLFVKINDVAVGVTFAEDGDEAEDIGSHAKTLAIGFDEAFGRYLRCAVKRGLDRDRSVLRFREQGRLAVDRSGRGECNVAKAIGAHRL